MLPFVFKNYFTQNYTVHKYNTKQSYDLFLQLRCYSSLSKKLIKFKASQLWNQLPNELKENKHSLSFKQQLKSICLVISCNYVITLLLFAVMVFD